MTNGRTIFISVLVSAVVATIFGGAAGLLFGMGGNQFRSAFAPTTSTTTASDSSGQNRTSVPESRVISEDSGVISVVKNVSPSVVSIVISKDVSNSAPFDDPLFRQFFGDGGNDRSQRQEVGGGSGFIVSEDGLILTNKHVVSDKDASYTVLLNDGKSFPAKVLARDPTNDIAILKVNITGLTPVKLADSSSIQIGQRVVAIGNALGEFSNTVSTGVISGLSRSITAGSGGFEDDAEPLRDVLQTDAAINPGNSGGPLLDMDGRVIGINTAIVQGAQNIGFALPINSAKADIESVLKNGKIVRPVLGIRYVPVNKALQIQGNLGSSYGAYIPGSGGNGEPTIIPEGPAAKAGLKERDIILAVNGNNISEDQSLPRVIEGYKSGQTVTLTVLRGGKRISLKLELGEASF